MNIKSSNHTNILFILSSFNIFGGTPKKTLDLLKYFGNRSFLYVYDDDHPEFKNEFKASGAFIYDGSNNSTLIKHIRNIIQIIDQNQIDIVQTQFTMGEILGSIVKTFRPKVKLIITFVGSTPPSNFKKFLVKQAYKKANAFVFNSEFVRSEKIKQFRILKKKINKVVFNGAEKRKNDVINLSKLKKYSLLDIAGLTELKNISIIIKAMDILINIRAHNDIFFYVAGDGPHREELEKMIIKYKLPNHVFLLGYQTDIGNLLNSCDIFVHPAYAEGFGIAVAEAMLAEKPIIVANAGALPELIEHEKTGIIVNPFDPEEWANEISRLICNEDYSKYLGRNAKLRAENDFSIQKYAENLDQFYNTLSIK